MTPPRLSTAWPMVEKEPRSPSLALPASNLLPRVGELLGQAPRKPALRPLERLDLLIPHRSRPLEEPKIICGSGLADGKENRLHLQPAIQPTTSTRWVPTLGLVEPFPQTAEWLEPPGSLTPQLKTRRYGPSPSLMIGPLGPWQSLLLLRPALHGDNSHGWNWKLHSWLPEAKCRGASWNFRWPQRAGNSHGVSLKAHLLLPEAGWPGSSWRSRAWPAQPEDKSPGLRRKCHLSGHGDSTHGPSWKFLSLQPEAVLHGLNWKLRLLQLGAGWDSSNWKFRSLELVDKLHGARLQSQPRRHGGRSHGLSLNCLSQAPTTSSDRSLESPSRPSFRIDSGGPFMRCGSWNTPMREPRND